MEINYLKIWNWKTTICISDSRCLDWYKKDFELFVQNNKEYNFIFLDYAQYSKFFKISIFWHVWYKNLDRAYKKSSTLKEYYSSLWIFLKSNWIKNFLVISTWEYWHPDFLESLKNLWIKLDIYTVDDDWSIEYCSLPYTKYYDHHFHVWVMYDKKITIAEKLEEFWQKNAVWLPLWALEWHINNNVSFDNRDIEVCYIWNVNPPKFFRLSKLKRHFWDRFKLYWKQWNWDWKSLKWIFYKICNKIFRLWYVEKISDEKLMEIYSRTKVGFNMHLNPIKWPSNIRLYELPYNWVMQLCDDIVWLKRIFNIWKEVIWYKDINDAIKKIDYYLEHENERKEIAYNGHLRTQKEEYRFQNTLEKIIEIICH